MRLDDLGSVQFERFCSELIGLEDVEGADFLPWGFALVRPEGVDVPGGGRLTGPALVLVVWLRHGASSPEAGLQLERIVEHVVAASATPPASLLLMTNVAGAAAPAGAHAVVLGSNELWDVLRARPELRFRLPFLLGVVERSRLVADDVARRSTFDIEASRRTRPRVRADARVRACARRARRSIASSFSPARPRWARPRSRACSASRAERRLGGARVHSARRALAALRARATAVVHRRRRLRLDRVPTRHRRALGARARPRAARARRASLADLDLAAGAAAGRAAPHPPRARRRALPAAGARSASTPPSSTPPRRR